ncbi:MAG: hypothetical protein GC136_04465 [Alphaproteobacteria bacterium]|nr:hypothetical protein [Alphaproteobacteria bacterium]
MQFLVIGMDGDDEGALARRMAVREAHIQLGDELLASGNMWYGAAILRDDGTMGGSALFMDFKDEAELQAWIDKEPYVTGDVWKSVTVHKCNTRDPWEFNRSKEFFEGRKK